MSPEDVQVPKPGPDAVPFGYIRKSVDRGEERVLSYEIQEEAIRAQARRHGALVEHRPTGRSRKEWVVLIPARGEHLMTHTRLQAEQWARLNISEAKRVSRLNIATRFPLGKLLAHPKPLVVMRVESDELARAVIKQAGHEVDA